MPINYSETQRKKIEEIREELTDLLTCASKSNLTDDQIAMLKDTLKAMEDVFLIVVVGEFNAGKSSFINALLNTEILKEGVTPTTAQIHLIRHGSKEQTSPIENWGLLVTLPSPLLDSISFVDTPGTNAVIAEHEILTKWFLPRADMVLFVTSVERPFTESESKFLDTIKDWGKKIVIIVNKTDLIEKKEDLDQVLKFVQENADKQLGSGIPIIPVSTRIAKQARNEISEKLWKESGFANLEKYIQEKIDDNARFKMKMGASLGIGEKLNTECLDIMNSQMKFYQADKDLADSINSQVNLYSEDMTKEIARSMNEIDAIFMKIKERGDEYFEELFKVKNIHNLMKKDKNKLAFQENVLANLPSEVERKTTEMVEMISIQQQRMIHSIQLQIEARKSQYPGKVLPTQVQSEREELLKRMQATIDNMLEKIEKDMALNIGMKYAQSAITAGLAIEVSAIGIGAALTIVFTTAAADILGIIAAFWVGVAGFLVLPYYKKKSQKEFAEKLDEIKAKLVKSLSAEFTEEIKGQVNEMNQAIQPFQRFVDTEIGNTETNIKDLEKIQTRLEDSKKSL